MFLKLIAVLYLIEFCYCDKSLTIVVDTTGSMQEEIDVIKANAEYFVKSIDGSDITKYIVVPFNNPDEGSPMVSYNTDEFLNSLNSLTASGGQIDCPENSLSGIEKGLQQSKPESFIFLFTDAYAKDSFKLEAISNLCRSTRSKVTIFLSGNCPSVPHKQEGSMEVYYDVTKACSGSMLRFKYYNLRKAFTFIKDLIKTEFNEVTNIERFREFNLIPLSVDEFSKDTIIAVSGDNPLIRVVHSDGRIMPMEGIFDTRLALASRLRDLAVGEYKINVRCYGLTSVTIYKRNELPYKIGFSIATPRSLKETSSRPIPGRTNNILVSASKDCTIKFESIELQMIQSKEKKTLLLEVLSEELGLYHASVFVDAHQAFIILVKGKDKETYKEFMSITKTIEPQQIVTDVKWSAPYIEIMESGNTLVEFDSKATLASKVYGFPQPSITWQDSHGKNLQSETFLLEVPTVFISYVNIDTTSNNTIYCWAENEQGKVSKSIDVYVHRPYSFNVIRSPSDTAIPYDSEGRLYCQIEAYPEASTKWYLNSILLEDSVTFSTEPDKGALVIRKMSLDQVGEYRCEATNEITHQSFSAFVNVTGLEKPAVTIPNSELILNPGEWTEVECSATGAPSPNITWQYKSNNDYEFKDLPEGVFSSDTKLKLPSVKMEHVGIYRCEATNLLGTDSADIFVMIHYLPVIKSLDTDTMTTNEGDFVTLPCEVDAIPEAKVWWEMTRGDVAIQLDERHNTDEWFNHRFNADSKDSGNYHCIAENSVGKAQKSITVNVLVSPYIAGPNSTEVYARVGSSVLLPCKISRGHPEPSLKWEFISPTDSTTTVIQHPSKDGLLLQNLSKAQEGLYRCIATNVVNKDSIRMYLRVY